MAAPATTSPTKQPCPQLYSVQRTVYRQYINEQHTTMAGRKEVEVTVVQTPAPQHRDAKEIVQTPRKLIAY